MTYFGIVIDRLSGQIMHRTKRVETWEDAQRRAEASAKKHGGDRYAIEVVVAGSERKPKIGSIWVTA